MRNNVVSCTPRDKIGFFFVEKMDFVVLVCGLFSMVICVASGNVVLTGYNATLSFDDVEANFAPRVKSSGECGVLYVAQPIDACSALVNKVEPVHGASSPFVLIVRGGCSFEDKVRTAQAAGYKASIVYDNDDGGILVAMAGNSAGIKIHAVFVSKASGEVLLKYAGITGMELWIIPSFENSAWSIMAISFISLLAMSAVLATCFFVRRHRIRRERHRGPRALEHNGMSSRLVKAIPSLIFTTVLEENCTSETCAICLEDYVAGEKLRILPCSHKFHAFCIDSWLTTWRTFCPVCKRDARTSMVDPPASENTPLLFSNPSSIPSSSAILSVPSSLASSSMIQIASPAQSYRNYQPHHQSPSLSMSRSSVDLRNASQRSQASYLVLPNSLGHTSFSPLNSRYRSPYFPSPSNASYGYMASSSQQPNPLHYSESANSFSPFASAQSLPEC